MDWLCVIIQASAQPWMGGLLKAHVVPRSFTWSGKLPSEFCWSNVTMYWSHAVFGSVRMSAIALKQGSQLQTEFIQFFDISMAGRVSEPWGPTTADQLTYAANSAAA